MEILVKGKKPSTAIFGCWDCECVFIANADEFYYDASNEKNWCVCPKCGAKCTGAELSCYFCKYTEQCEIIRHNDKDVCDPFKVDKSKLWISLGYLDEEK